MKTDVKAQKWRAKRARAPWGPNTTSIVEREKEGDVSQRHIEMQRDKLSRELLSCISRCGSVHPVLLAAEAYRIRSFPPGHQLQPLPEKHKRNQDARRFKEEHRRVCLGENMSGYNRQVRVSL